MFSNNENKKSVQALQYIIVIYYQYSMSHYSQKLKINTLMYSHVKIHII